MLKVLGAILVMGIGSFTAVVLADPPSNAQGHYKAQLSGLEEVPAILTGGSGDATIDVEKAPVALKVRLKYSGLSSAPVFGTLQLGQPGVLGSPVALLCGGTEKACPSGNGEVEITITPSKILAVPNQGVESNKLEPVLAALDAGVLYVNVSTGKFATGEIRGQLVRGRRQGGDDEDDDRDMHKK